MTADMVPLIDGDMYRRLESKRREISTASIGDVARVFVPVGAAPTVASPDSPRVLFVGKATSGYGEPALASFEGAKRRDEEVVREYLPNGRTAFWQFGRKILRQTLRLCAIPAADSELPSFCGWSNLAKIGDLSGNPPPKSVEMQKELCVEALRSEIAFFKPTAVIAVPQNFAQHEIMEPVFGEDDKWYFDTPGKDRVAYQIHKEFETLVIWTNHPQGMSPPGTRALVQEFAAELIVGAMRGRPLPPGAIEPPP
jgi:hypothetical protein